MELFLSLVPSQEDPQDPSADGSFRLYFKPQLESIFQEYDACKSEKTIEQFVKEKNSEASEVLEIVEDSRHEERASLVSSRKSKILSKLRALGYTDTDFSTYSDLPTWRWKQLVNQPRDLTDKVWANIRPELEDIIRLRRERQAKLLLEKRQQVRRMEVHRFYKNSRRNLYDDDDYEARLLRIEDLFTKEEVKNLIESGNSLEPITTQQWSLIEEMLPQLVRDHVRLVERDCYNVLALAHRTLDKDIILQETTKHGSGARNGMDRRLLKSATAFLTTANNRVTLQSYSDILKRRMMTEMPYYTYDPSSGSSWEDMHVLANVSAVKVAVFLLKEAGFAQWASMQHLRSKGCSFKCRRCPKENRFYMTWIQLVGHFMEENNHGVSTKAHHELKSRPKKAVKLLRNEVVDKEAPRDTSNLPFDGVLDGVIIPVDPQTFTSLDSDESDSESHFSDYYGFGMGFDDDDFFDDYFYEDEYPDSEDEGCVIC
ncbi:hypothetical protein SCHPADRAFT_543769 [Schizopora paradoxa]|uniref:Uncharacterized protein n=1 Tax=Schizopora paradoxa TaxID=27342 RepID=A0A0H2RKH8_9AGAM|nr:hypothetical protein SCHPADRAFT_543769 [Schizopora paradoxa]